MNAEEQACVAKVQRIQGPQADFIELNVGGQILATTRSTLCQVEGSLLANMFIGRWENRLKRDKDGAVFFDFNPQYFILILDYLRARKIASADHPAPLPTVPKDQLKIFTTLVEYLGLRFLLGEKFNSHSDEIALQENEKVAVYYGLLAHPGYALGENVYNKGIAKLKLKLESSEDNRWPCVFVGVVKDDAVKSDYIYEFDPEENASNQWSGSYGWEFGSTSDPAVWKDGRQTAEKNLWGISKNGDIVELILDCEAGKLSLHFPTGHKFCIEIPKSASWRLNVNLTYPEDKIRIMEN